MKASHFGMTLKNLLLFCIVVVPVWYAVATLQGRAASPGGRESLSLGGALFISLVYIPYMLPGWVLQQIALIAAQRTAGRAAARMFALLTVTLPGASLWVLHPAISNSDGAWASLAPGLLLYGLTCWLPATPSTSAQRGAPMAGA